MVGNTVHGYIAGMFGLGVKREMMIGGNRAEGDGPRSTKEILVAGILQIQFHILCLQFEEVIV